MPSEAVPDFDLYKTLEVDPGASVETIQAAYRSLAKRNHPDVAGGAGQERMKRINLAYEWLSDADRRLRFDRTRVPRSRAEPRPRRGPVATATAQSEAHPAPAPQSARSQYRLVPPTLGFDFGLHDVDVHEILDRARKLSPREVRRIQLVSPGTAATSRWPAAFEKVQTVLHGTSTSLGRADGQPGSVGWEAVQASRWSVFMAAGHGTLEYWIDGTPEIESGPAARSEWAAYRRAAEVVAGAVLALIASEALDPEARTALLEPWVRGVLSPPSWNEPTPRLWFIAVCVLVGATLATYVTLALGLLAGHESPSTSGGRAAVYVLNAIEWLVITAAAARVMFGFARWLVPRVADSYVVRTLDDTPPWEVPSTSDR